MSENKVIQWYLEKTLKNWEKNTKMFLNNLEAITSCELWKPWKIIKPHTRLLRSCNQKPILIFSILGKTCPRPVKAWQQCGVTSKIFDILKANFEKPTPIQAQAIPVIMSGRDMMGIAKTGSGKTLAFLLPLFRHINAQPELEEEDGPIGTIHILRKQLYGTKLNLMI